MKYFKQDMIVKELAKIVAEEPLLNYDGSGVFKTSNRMFDSGIACCSDCGYLQPLEKKICGKCGNDVVVVRDREPQPLKRIGVLKPVPGKQKRIKKNTYV